MVKIIKRIIVGVGIALVLSCFSKFGLIGNVSAMSCDTDYENRFFAFSGIFEDTWSDNTLNNPSWGGVNFTTYRIPWKEGYDYIEIYSPAMFTIHSTANTTPNYSIDLVSSGAAWAILNNTTSGVTNWQRGYYKDGRFVTRYYKQDYPNQDYLEITGFRMAAPSFLGNWSSVYVYMRVEEMWKVAYFSCDSNKQIEQSIKDNTEAIEETNNTIKDDSVDNDKANTDIQSMQGKVASNGSITQLLTLPIQLYQSILNSVSGSCSSFNLGNLFNHNIVLPCINLSNLLGSSLYTIIDILCSGLFILSFRKKMVDIFNHMTSLNDRGNELE